MPTIMRFLIAAVVAPIVLAYSQPAHSIAGDNVYLRCKGTIAIHGSQPTQIEDKQEIVVHIKSGKISFSGNILLIGENIQICTPSKPQPYFDSETCEGRSRKDRKRKYGTFDKVTGALDLTNEIWEGDTAFISGRFTCSRAEPLIK